jgi:ABC-type phosphate/phosphonate transport system ATPase subunit
MLASVARAERLGILASAASWALARAHAHRVLAIADGLLVFEGAPAALSHDPTARRAGLEIARRV